MWKHVKRWANLITLNKSVSGENNCTLKKEENLSDRTIPAGSLKKARAI